MLSNRMSLLASDPEYSWLKELGIDAECAGIYDGEWKSGNGEKLTSICPINGRPIATVKSATMAEYDQVVNAARDAFKVSFLSNINMYNYSL